MQDRETEPERPDAWDEDYWGDRTETRGWIKIHAGCGGRVIFREASEDWCEQTHYCTRCHMDYPMEHVASVHVSEFDKDVTVDDLLDIPADALAELFHPCGDDEVAEYLEVRDRIAEKHL